MERAIERVAFYLTQTDVEALDCDMSEAVVLLRKSIYERLENIFHETKINQSSSYRIAEFLRSFSPGAEFWISILQDVQKSLSKNITQHIVLVPTDDIPGRWKGYRLSDAILSEEIIDRGLKVPWNAGPLRIPESLAKVLRLASVWWSYSIECSSESLAYKFRDIVSLEDAISRVIEAVWFQEGKARYRIGHYTMKANLPSVVVESRGVQAMPGMLKRDLHMVPDRVRQPGDPAFKIASQLQLASSAKSDFLADIGDALRAIRASLEVEDIHLRVLLLCCSLENLAAGEQGGGRDVRVRIPFLFSRQAKQRREYDEFLRKIYRQRNSVAHSATSEVEIGEVDKLFWLAANTAACAAIFTSQFTGASRELRDTWLRYLDGLRFGDSELIWAGDQELSHFEDYDY
jgi:hypothetical protein